MTNTHKQPLQTPKTQETEIETETEREEEEELSRFEDEGGHPVPSEDESVE